MSPRSINPGFKIPEPNFSSSLLDLILDLEYLKRNHINITTEGPVYEQFRHILGDMDSLASARLDGNQTGLSKYLEAKQEDPETKGIETREIDAIAKANRLIHENLDQTIFFSGFFTELHKLLREDLSAENQRHAGQFRKGGTGESNTPTKAPAPHLIEPYLNKLINLINKKYPSKYDGLKVSFSHHKFLWMHPLRDSNGLVARLLSLAMLLKSDLTGPNNRIINPTFCLAPDPEKYQFLLEKADADKAQDYLNLFEFQLESIRNSLYLSDKLFDYSYVKESIIEPALEHPMFSKLFTDQDRLIMNIAVDKQVFQAADIRVYFPNKSPNEISKMLKWHKEKELIIPIEENSRKYVVNLNNKYLIKQIIAKMDEQTFLPFGK